MTKLLLNIPDDLAARLQEFAARSGVSVEEMALTQLGQLVETAPSTTPEEISDADFESVAQRAVKRDIELLRRLAK